LKIELLLSRLRNLNLIDYPKRRSLHSATEAA
jgi:hypothetical protein